MLEKERNHGAIPDRCCIYQMYKSSVKLFIYCCESICYHIPFIDLETGFENVTIWNDKLF